MPRAGLSAPRLVEIALDVAADDGTITLAAVAARAGVRTPSLYKHVESLGELESLVAEHVLTRLADHVDAALGGRRGIEAAAAALDAYRSFARAHPTLYRLLPVQPRNDPRLAPVGRRLLVRIAEAIGFDDLAAPEALHALRLIRAGSDGFIRLEMAGGFGEPADVDASWEHLVAIVSQGAVPQPSRPAT